MEDGAPPIVQGDAELRIDVCASRMKRETRDIEFLTPMIVSKNGKREQST
ncbi:Uncharacterized protein APZ42_026433 [Daphnia magna]|uniref:Uncharacterized protein n=1 Tax=Daphnia magna TaxID=35525 RepID=A0A164S6M9_9CRUS|nr:Uncharacterized protein APZ42_026433 [Daphnia magna]